MKAEHAQALVILELAALAEQLGEVVRLQAELGLELPAELARALDACAAMQPDERDELSELSFRALCQAAAWRTLSDQGARGRRSRV